MSCRGKSIKTHGPSYGYCPLDPANCPPGWGAVPGNDGRPTFKIIPGNTATRLGGPYCFGDFINKVDRRRPICQKYLFDSKNKVACCRGQLNDKFKCDPRWCPGGPGCAGIRPIPRKEYPDLIDQIGAPTNRIQRSFSSRRRSRKRESFTNPGAWVGIGAGALVLVGSGVWWYTKKKK